MSEILDKAAAALTEKLAGVDLGMAVKFVIEGVGAITVDGEQTPPTVRQEDGDAAVTITAEQDTFKGLMDGSLNATAAYMSGRLKIDGDMGAAMKLASALT